MVYAMKTFKHRTLSALASLCLLAILPIGAFAASVTLEWDANSESDLAGYRVYQGTSSLMTPVVISTEQAAGYSYISKITLGTTVSYTISGLANSTSYFFRLTAFDTSGNESGFNVNGSDADVEVSTITPPPSGDVTAPTAPSGLTASAVNVTSFTLTWAAATDAVGVAGYRLDLSLNSSFSSFVTGFNNKELGNVLTTNATGLTAQTTYYARVKAYDAADNVSPNSSWVSTVTLSGPDVTAPSIPAGLSLSAPTTDSLTLSWTASTDNVGVTGYRLDVSVTSGFSSYVTGYNNKNLGAVTTTIITGLASGTTYYARLRAYDAAANTSGNSSAVSRVTSGVPPAVINDNTPVLSSAKFFTPWKKDGINDTVTFGEGAKQVEIFNMNSRKVFKATKSGTNSIVWSGTDDSGHLLESGVYIIKVTGVNGKRKYQSIVIVK